MPALWERSGGGWESAPPTQESWACRDFSLLAEYWPGLFLSLGSHVPQALTAYVFWTGASCTLERGSVPPLRVLAQWWYMSCCGPDLLSLTLFWRLCWGIFHIKKLLRPKCVPEGEIEDGQISLGSELGSLGPAHNRMLICAEKPCSNGTQILTLVSLVFRKYFDCRNLSNTLLISLQVVFPRMYFWEMLTQRNHFTWVGLDLLQKALSLLKRHFRAAFKKSHLTEFQQG